jgi:hypothetical protein
MTAIVPSNRSGAVAVEAGGLVTQLGNFVRCLYEGREGMKHRKPCGYRKYLDLESIVCTRGGDFPIARMAQCLRCPRCGVGMCVAHRRLRNLMQRQRGHIVKAVSPEAGEHPALKAD